MIYQETEIKFISEIIGNGLVAKKLIPKGTIAWVKDDLDTTYTQSDIEKLNPKTRKQLDDYSFVNSNGEKVLCWDNAKYINHSFNSNCMLTAYDFRVAVRDILPGEELTYDYGAMNIATPFTPTDEGFDRKIVCTDDLLNFYETWDNLILDTIHFIDKVPQPLIQYINRNIWLEFEEVMLHRKQLKSIKTCYYNSN